VCCDIVNGHTITNSQTTSGLGLTHTSNIVVENGGILIVNSELALGEGGTILVEDGGTLDLRASAFITTCVDAISWGGVIVESGGELKMSGGTMEKVSRGVTILSGSIIDISGGQIYGQALISANGVQIDGTPSAFNFRDIAISGFKKGILVDNGVSGLIFFNPMISNVTTGVHLNGATNCKIITGSIEVNSDYGRAVLMSSATGSTIGFLNPCGGAIRAEYSPECLIIDNNVAGSISLLSSPGTTIDFNRATNGCLVHRESNNCTVVSNNIQGLTGVSISNNVSFIENTVKEDEFFYAMSDIFTEGTVISNNIIFDATRGLINQGSLHGEYMDNQIDSDSHCIEASGSPNGIYHCNQLYSNQGGLLIQENSDGQEFKFNTIGATNDMEIRSILGRQGVNGTEHWGNQFVGGNTISHLDFIGTAQSPFFVDSDFTYTLPDNPIPANNQWFRDEIFVNNTLDCGDDPTGSSGFWEVNNSIGRCNRYQSLLDQFGMDSPQMTAFLLNALRLGYSEDHFINDCNGDPWPPDDCFTKIIEIEEALIGEPFSSPSSLELASLMPSRTENVRDHTATTNNRIDALSIQVQGEYRQFLSERKERLKTLKEEIDDIKCDNYILQTSVDIMLAYIDHYLIRENETNDYRILLNYARLCAAEYGRSVYLARAVAIEYTNEDFSVNDTCLRSKIDPRSAKYNNNNQRGTVYPNPSTGIIEMSFTNPKFGKIFILDANGRTVNTYHLTGVTKLNIDLEGYQGLHLIKLVESNGSVELHKCIILE